MTNRINSICVDIQASALSTMKTSMCEALKQILSFKIPHYYFLICTYIIDSSISSSCKSPITNTQLFLGKRDCYSL